MNSDDEENTNTNTNILPHRISLNFLVRERNAYEILIYDFLVNPFEGVPESFWEPVKVSFDGVKDLENIIGEDTCFICSESHLSFKKVNCCNQKYVMGVVINGLKLP
jgi:hypothetical protein